MRAAKVRLLRSGLNKTDLLRILECDLFKIGMCCFLSSELKIWKCFLI